MAYIRYRSQTVAIEVCFPFNFAVVFDFIHFRLRSSKAKSIENVLTNRRSAALRSMVFFSFIMRIAYWRTESLCVLRQCGVDRKKAPRNTFWRLKTLQNWTELPNGATYIANCLLILLYWAETEIHNIKDDSKIKREKNIDRRGQRHIGSVWHLPDPPSFSLPTTFNSYFIQGI